MPDGIGNYWTRTGNRPSGHGPRPSRCLGVSTGCWNCCPKRRNKPMSGRVSNSQKILSLYETDVRVVVRGKAEAEVEVGITVLIGENAQGILLDYQLWRQPAPADVNLLVESLERVSGAMDRTVGAVA